MSKLRLNDLVFVRSGKFRTKTGNIEKIDHKSDKAWVNGLNIVKTHRKKSQLHPQGGIVEKHMPLPLSILMLVDAKKKKPTRIRLERKNGQLTRVAVKSGEMVEGTDKKKTDK